MKRYSSTIIKIFSFIFLVIIADQVIGLILRKLYFHEKVGPDHSLNYVFSDCKAEVLILGSSTAVHHYDSRIISERLQMSCYNAGIDGGHSILLPYALLKVVTMRYVPKIVIIDFPPKNIVHFAGDYDRLSILLPYYKEYPDVRPLILLRSPYERIKLLSAIYPFNSNIINISRVFLNFHAEKFQDFNGFIPLRDETLDVGLLKIEHEIEAPSVIDTNMINALKNIIGICKEKKIILVIVSSPIFHFDKREKPTSSLAEKLSLEIIHKWKINCYDFSFDSTFAGKSEWFKDREHLNDKGAEIFTNLVINKILSEK